MNKPARFTQAELSRVMRAAKALGARVIVEDGKIEVDFAPRPESQQEQNRERPEFAPAEDFAL